MQAIPVTSLKVGSVRIRPFKGSKKRPAFIVRPTLREVNSRLKQLRSQGRTLRGELRRCPALDAQRQLSIHNSIVSVKQSQESILRYWGNVTAIAD